MMQLSLFDAGRMPPVCLPVDPDGSVVQDDPDAVYRLKHPRMALDLATIELHRHANGKWMWGTSWHCGERGGGYRVGEKWGKFAESREDALHYAVQEIAGRLDGDKSIDAKEVLTWMASL